MIVVNKDEYRKALQQARGKVTRYQNEASEAISSARRALDRLYHPYQWTQETESRAQAAYTQVYSGFPVDQAFQDMGDTNLFENLTGIVGQPDLPQEEAARQEKRETPQERQLRQAREAASTMRPPPQPPMPMPMPMQAL